MPLAKNVMGANISAGKARSINGNNVNATITAAGTTQGTATALTADVIVITTATTGQGVILYSGVPGDDQWVYNDTLVDIRVYPHVGGSINQIAANSAFVLAPKTCSHCKLINSTRWVVNLSA